MAQTLTSESIGKRLCVIDDLVMHAIHAAQQSGTDEALDSLMTYLTWQAIPAIAEVRGQEVADMIPTLEV